MIGNPLRCDDQPLDLHFEGVDVIDPAPVGDPRVALAGGQQIARLVKEKVVVTPLLSATRRISLSPPGTRELSGKGWPLWPMSVRCGVPSPFGSVW